MNHFATINKEKTIPRAMFIGRWQPFHNGHKWLIDTKLKKMIPILICVRDIPSDEKNPFTTKQTIQMIRQVFINDDVIVMSIPDIESINYGRGVGYEINNVIPPNDIKQISATEIRNGIHNKTDAWKNYVPGIIQNDIINYLKDK